MSSKPGNTAGDISEKYAHPEEILRDKSLSRDEKAQLLNEWEQDLRQLMVASEENMAGTVTGQPAESLAAVHEALAELEGRKPESSHKSPAKQG
ncbi:MAG: hypothetical protein GC201_04655 [Alphaproteobacteria bacterium]|nr:hypothetical protein [Alphaproteobacteria bacterium]